MYEYIIQVELGFEESLLRLRPIFMQLVTFFFLNLLLRVFACLYEHAIEGLFKLFNYIYMI